MFAEWRKMRKNFSTIRRKKFNMLQSVMRYRIFDVEIQNSKIPIISLPEDDRDIRLWLE